MYYIGATASISNGITNFHTSYNTEIPVFQAVFPVKPLLMVVLNHNLIWIIYNGIPVYRDERYTAGNPTTISLIIYIWYRSPKFHIFPRFSRLSHIFIFFAFFTKFCVNTNMFHGFFLHFRTPIPTQN